MRLQKEEKIAIVLLLMALSSLAIAAWSIGGLEQSATTNVNSEVSVEGMVLGLNPTKSGGNVILQLDSTPAAVFVSQNSGAKEVMGKVKIGDRIRVMGKETDFQGSKEITVNRAKDVEVIGASG
ncbi:MAG: hypothetical protein WB392_12900 [Methanotrichaceae archaeon]